MTDDSIDALDTRIAETWRRTGVAPLAQVLRVRADDGSPHVEWTGTLYDIVITERGGEHARHGGLTLAEAARWFLSGAATGHALDRELAQRRAPPLPRRAPDRGAAVSATTAIPG